MALDFTGYGLIIEKKEMRGERMLEKGSVRTNKDRQLSIVEGIKPYLVVAAPYSVWNPEAMDFRVARMTRTLTSSEIENRYLQGKYPISDMHILRAIHYFGFASMPAIEKLLQYWRDKDVIEAKRGEREQLCIPPVLGKGRMWGRLETLCQNGVVACHEFFVNPSFRSIDHNTYESGIANKGTQPWRIFSVTGTGAAMYRTALQDKTVSYDQRDRYLGEDEVFRRVMCANMVASFLDSPYLSHVRFAYKQSVGRKWVPLLAVLEMQPEGGGKDCRLLMESITVWTNPRVVTHDARIRSICERLKDLRDVLEESRKDLPTFLLICAEDARGIETIRSCIAKTDPEMFQFCLITTGTILEAKQTIQKPNRLAESFLEFHILGGKAALQGATGYYFLTYPGGGDYGKNQQDKRTGTGTGTSKCSCRF